MVQYDVFLSHNSSDKDVVHQLAVLLREARVSVFLDRWYLLPGDAWQESLEVAFEGSGACAVCVGSDGVGPWQNEEMRSALERRVRSRAFRVIPVLLPGASEQIRRSVPPFLKNLQWVDFSSGLEDRVELARLVAGLRGRSDEEGPHATAVQSLIVLSGPSSVGKDVALNRLLFQARRIGMVCDYLKKYTTRDPRPDEDSDAAFTHLAPSDFHQRVDAGEITCVRYSYEHYYGLDAALSGSGPAARHLFASQRLYKEIQDLRGLCRDRGVRLFAVLMTADRRSLQARILQRSLSAEQKRRRMEQMLEDLDLFDNSPDDLEPYFDLVVHNGDERALASTVAEIWAALMNSTAVLALDSD